MRVAPECPLKTGVPGRQCGLHRYRARCCSDHVNPASDVLTDLARLLVPVAERPVLDATGLAGAFDRDLTFTPVDAPDPTSGASLFTAIQEQLGLRLEPRQAPMNVLVIDSAEHPTPD